uniref:Uncharacterized protein n=1 Tax=Lactuca sativa TaxID=4236 RepID=A0A9R1XQ78_LACSA|nr:hypothetical protein LSAT_V11C200091470 [Lactuca sativa]
MLKMKTLLLLLFSTISLSMGQPSPNQLRDLDGNLVRSGTKYYILHVIRGMGGGLIPASTRNESCPLDVVQANQEVNNGLPLTFTPVNPKKGVIRESTDLNIIFLAASTCIQSNVWMLEEYDGQLIKYEDHYKLMFCPTVCDICKPVCGNIGVVIAKNGSRRLAISEVPLKIMFKKA